MSQEQQNKLGLSYDEVCKIIGHLILNSRSEINSLENNLQGLLQQLQEKNQEIQQLKTIIDEFREQSTG